MPSPSFDSASGDMYPLIAWNALLGAVSYRVAVDEPDGDHAEYDDFRSAAASFGKMTGTGVLGVRVRANFPTKTGQATPGPWSGTVNFTRTMGEPTGARTDASPTSLLFSWDPKPGTKQYRVLVANREDFATTVEDVSDRQRLVGSDAHLDAVSQRRNVLVEGRRLRRGQQRRRLHARALVHAPEDERRGGIRVSQRLRIFVKGRLRAHRMSRVVVTIKAGARSSAKVRGLGLGMRARWRATNRRGQVVFRFRPKGKGMVFFQATKRNYLVGTARVRVR